MKEQLAEAFRRIPYGIFVLTTKRDGQAQAMIVSWVAQVSYSPPLLMVALRQGRPALPAMNQGNTFALSLMKKEQKPLVSLFKDPSYPNPFSDLFTEIGDERPPFLKEAMAFFACRILSRMEAGDHIIFIGEVELASSTREGQPLTTADYGKTYIGQS